MSFVPVHKFDDDQIIITSDRLIFNSSTDNIFQSAKKDLAITVGGSVHINVGPSKGDPSKNQFVVNAPKIQFGLGKIQPAVKGDDLVKVLNDLLSSLNDLASNLSTATGIGVGTVAQPTVNAAGIKLQGQVQNISSQVSKIKSTVVFTA
jgi:hypothetical protein